MLTSHHHPESGYQPDNDSEPSVTPPAVQGTQAIGQSHGKPKDIEQPAGSKAFEQHKKTFSLPTRNEETFIDHGCTIDAQGYPLLPNGNTTYVKTVGASITNFGHVGFSKRVCTEYRSYGTWKVKRIYCLGVLCCDVPGCRWAGAPPTGRIDMKEYLERNSQCPGSAGTCPGNVRHIQCQNTIIRVDEHIPTGWAVLRHSGLHNHVWPEAKKPDKLAQETLKNEILKNPNAGALALKLGKPKAPNDPFDSFSSIHPALAHADRLQYYRKLMLQELDITPDQPGGGAGDEFITEMFEWNKRGLRIISVSFMPENEHFTFQTEWMAKLVLSRSTDNEVYSTGLVSEVNHRFFEDALILSTSMYCEELARWVPIQLTWIRGLSKSYYQVHFATLLRQFLKPDISQQDRDILVGNIVYFSLAQREGFVEAYWEVFGECDKKIVLDKLQGCHEHFRAQVTRLKRNRHVIMADDEGTFAKLCMDLIKQPEEGDASLKDKIDKLRRLSPKAKKWIDWWTMADVEAMLFPSCQPILEDAPESHERPTQTKKAQQSLRRPYYMISAGKSCLIQGMVQLFSFVKVLEEDYDAVMCGKLIEYGAARKGQTDIAQSLGWEKKRKRVPSLANSSEDQTTSHIYQ